MRNKDHLTFIIAHHSGARMRSMRIPRRMLYLAGCLAGLCLLISGLALFQYVSMARQMDDFARLKNEFRQVQLENRNYQIQSSRMEEKLSSLEAASMKISILSGLESVNPKSGWGGVGGYSKAAFDAHRTSNLGDAQALRAYEQSMENLEERYRSLQNYFETKALRSAFTPSIWPVNGYLTAGFGYRADPFSNSRDYHEGVDISAPTGKKVLAPADGVVIFAGPREGYGYTIVLDHKFGTTTRYGHLSKILVRVGSRVSRGDALGYVGTTGRTTGSHLHYEVRIYDRPVNPVQFMKTFFKVS